MSESINRKSKSYSSHKIIEYKGNAKNWNVMEELIGKTRKSEPHLPWKLLINEHEVFHEEDTENKFNTSFTNIASELVKRTPNASSLFERYLRKYTRPSQQTLLQLTRSNRHFFH